METLIKMQIEMNSELQTRMCKLTRNRSGEIQLRRKLVCNNKCKYAALFRPKVSNCFVYKKLKIQKYKTTNTKGYKI